MTERVKIRILVVNDDQPMNKLWQQLINLTDDMTCIGSAINGEDAVEFALSLKPDVVVMDMMMPGIDGGEATRQILEQLPQTLVIVYSAYNGMEDRAYDNGAIEYLLMPIPPEKLRDTIRRVYSDRPSV